MAQKTGNKIDPRVVRTLLGGQWPGEFHWPEVEYFGRTSPDTIQGYNGYGEPIGPGFEFSIKMIP